MKVNGTAVKFFIIWFISLLISIAIAVTTHHSLAINSVLVLVIVLGCIMIKDTTVDAYYFFSSSSWPTTLYTITSSRVHHLISGKSKYRAYHKALFELEYKVEGQIYKLPAHDLDSPVYPSEEDAEEYIRKARSGEYGVSVYYNPSKPSQAFIKPGLRLRHFLAMATGLGFIIVPILTITGKITWI